MFNASIYDNETVTSVVVGIDKAGIIVGDIPNVINIAPINYAKLGERLKITTVYDGATITTNSVDKGTLYVVGMGDGENFSVDEYRKLVVDVAKKIRSDNHENVLWGLTGHNMSPTDYAREALLGVNSAMYELNTYRTKFKNVKFEQMYFMQQRHVGHAADAGIANAIAICNGINLAKDVSNAPANHMTPTDFHNVACQVSHQFPSANLSVIKEHEMLGYGMGGILSVGNGSKQQSLVTILEHAAQSKDAPTVALIGKAVTFDSGGISLKRSNKMDEMKFDMCGGATVLGVMSTVMELKLDVNVIMVVGAVENMPGDNATRPGDIITMYNDTTVCVSNTDAEGRLVLADMLEYVNLNHSPDVVIDVATLTGSAAATFGNTYSAIFTDSDTFASDITEDGENTGDLVWRLPMHSDYDDKMKDEFADVNNTGAGAGACSAAGFLRRFTNSSYDWMHIDIAGTAWDNKRATGRPVNLLVEYLKNMSNRVV